MKQRKILPSLTEAKDPVRKSYIRGTEEMVDTGVGILVDILAGVVRLMRDTEETTWTAMEEKPSLSGADRA
jgi:hypothetical protein